MSSPAPDWKDRHLLATLCPTPRSFESAMVGMLHAWIAYGETHKRRYDSPIGNDYVLGPEWARIGRALRGLLNGDLGRLDGGTLDRDICTALERADCEVE